MRILRIAGRNLASLAGDFEVDFQSGQLATAGLFAICGPTGAGKSTLLDALCLALYDATPRLLKMNTAAARLPDVGDETVSILDPRTLLRRGAAEGFAEVDFEAGDGLRYRARWSVRRSRNKASGILQRADMTLHSLPALAPIGRTNKEVLAEIAQRIGLSFEQFTRSVLLAQNEFSAFLKTEENERGELLETLTGSTIYSSLSKRAFERARAEQAKLQLLTARLADQVPMPVEERSAMETASAAAHAALAALEPRKAALERQLRWFEDEARLRASIESAMVAAHSADAAHTEAASRQARLEAIDRVQSARPLVAEAARLAQAGETLQATAVKAQVDAATCQATAAASGAAVDLARAAMESASVALRDAQPMLDAAKAVDARLSALEEPHAAAGKRQAVLEAEQAQIGANIAALEQEQATLASAQALASAWLEQHAGAAMLATQWERWDSLLARAARATAELAARSISSDDATKRRQMCTEALERARQQLAQAAAQVEAAQAARNGAARAAQGLDIAGLQAQRSGLEHRNRALQSARQAWQEWKSAQEAHSAALLAVEQAKAQAGQHTGALAEARGQLPALEATALQAARSLSFARLACADNVEALRSQLEEDEPCPVCGSAEHPYKVRDPALHVLLDKLDHDAAQAGQARDAARAAVTTLQERLAASQAQAAAAVDTATRLHAALDAAHGAWKARPGFSEGRQEQAFAAAMADLATESEALAAREEALRDALAAREAAQQALDAAIVARDSAARTVESATANAASAEAAFNSAQQELTQLRQSLDADMAELDAPLSKISNGMIEEFEHGWRADWQDNPAHVHTRMAALARDWAGRTTELAAAVKAMADLQGKAAAMAEARVRVQGGLATAVAEAARLGEALADLRKQRSAMFEGRAVAEVGAALQQKLDAASAQHAAALAAATRDAEAAALAQAAVANTAAALAANASAIGSAACALREWLGEHPGISEASLAELLAHTPEWVREERAALAQLDTARTSAHAVLRERREQHRQHLEAMAHEPGQTVESSRDALATLLAERDAALAQAANLRRALDQDDARRQAATSLQAELEAQQLEERRWARMNELIGSSDGKKFRNYAQQFTLDVLLGYANAHLQQLARRYRLERVAASTGPSLGLMVRDQDMGGEIRSVNSLSGGESFLVSLALALGLASLSSNRVKVESLFIDEGFGSLDSETLRVAMEALDGLQATGRRVGVISHVQEMTERIAVRIAVLPAGGGSSTVTVA